MEQKARYNNVFMWLEECDRLLSAASEYSHGSEVGRLMEEARMCVGKIGDELVRRRKKFEGMAGLIAELVDTLADLTTPRQ